MVTVKIVSKSSGNPVRGAKVSIGVDAVFSGGVTSTQSTDSNGEAHFDIKPSQGKVFVDGSTRHEGHLSGRV